MQVLLEAIMMICFGVSWPFSVWRSYHSRSTKGKSLLFLVLIWIGYITGIIGKVLYAPSYVIIVYTVNAFMVFLDIILYFRNKQIEKETV